MLSTKEASELSGLSPDSITRLLRQGRIEGRKVGRTWDIDSQSFYVSLIASWQPHEIAEQTAHLLDYVTTHYCRSEHYNHAEMLTKHLLAVYEKIFGEGHPHTFPILAALAKMYCHPSRLDESAAISQRLLALQENALGPDHPALVSTLAQLAEICWEDGTFADAEQYLLRAL